jgi:hypothetical protein
VFAALQAAYRTMLSFRLTFAQAIGIFMQNLQQTAVSMFAYMDVCMAVYAPHDLDSRFAGSCVCVHACVHSYVRVCL